MHTDEDLYYMNPSSILLFVHHISWSLSESSLSVVVASSSVSVVLHGVARTPSAQAAINNASALP